MAKALTVSLVAITGLLAVACGKPASAPVQDTVPEAVSITASAPASAVSKPCCTDGPSPWYMNETKPATLKYALEADLKFLGEDHIGFRTSKGFTACTTYSLHGLPCDYNTRYTLSKFLTVNGKGLFPAKGGTNRVVSEMIADGTYKYDGPDDVFIGTPEQNAMLLASVRKNAALFKDGLTATEVQESWR